VGGHSLSRVPPGGAGPLHSQAREQRVEPRVGSRGIEPSANSACRDDGRRFMAVKIGGPRQAGGAPGYKHDRRPPEGAAAVSSGALLTSVSSSLVLSVASLGHLSSVY
jgi:hypothetical protein